MVPDFVWVFGGRTVRAENVCDETVKLGRSDSVNSD